MIMPTAGLISVYFLALKVAAWYAHEQSGKASDFEKAYDNGCRMQSSTSPQSCDDISEVCTGWALSHMTAGPGLSKVLYFQSDPDGRIAQAVLPKDVRSPLFAFDCGARVGLFYQNCMTRNSGTGCQNAAYGALDHCKDLPRSQSEKFKQCLDSQG